MNKNELKNVEQAECASDLSTLNLVSSTFEDESNLLRESGFVSSIKGEFAYVNIQRQSGCGGCASSSGCGTSALATLFSNTSQGPIKVRNKRNVQVGDYVTLTLDESRLIKHSFMAYGVPLIGLFVFSMLFSVLSVRVLDASESVADIAAIFGGFSGVALGWWLTHIFYQPVLPEIEQPNL